MIRGLQTFKDHFSEHKACYVLIGGAACDVHMQEARIDYRATKDLDIILCVEALNTAFASDFWAFIKAGNYQQREKNNGDKEFYRFSNPEDERYPAQLELFSRTLESIPVDEGVHLTPLPLEGEASSLSAILLDEDYYACLTSGTVVIDDVRLLNVEYLVLFKAKAVLDLSERKAQGEFVRSDDIKKHRYDVFRLLQLLPPTQRVTLAESLQGDIRAFVQLIEQEPTSDEQLLQIAIAMPFSQIITTLNTLFQLSTETDNQLEGR